MRLRALGLLCLLAVLICSAVPAGAASPSPSPTPDAVALRAKEWLHRLQTGDIDRSQLAQPMDAALTPDVVKAIVAKYGPLGDPQSFTFLGQQAAAGDLMQYVYKVVFASTTLNEVFVLDKDGKVAGLFLQPAQ